MQIVLRTQAPEGTEVVLPALAYAKILEEHPAVADLAIIDRTVRDPYARRPERDLYASGSFAVRLDCGCSSRWSSARCLRSSRPCFCRRPAHVIVATATVHVSADDLELSGSYEPTGDVLYLAGPGDDKRSPAQETPEGHAVRLDDAGRATHLTAINARWLLERHGQLVATLRDGRRLQLGREDVADLLT